MDSYYFTFGTDERYPYQGGYVEIIAASMKEAQAIFRANFPDRTPGILNCADYYTRAEMEKTGMLEGGNRGAGRHCRLMSYSARFFNWLGRKYGWDAEQYAELDQDFQAQLESEFLSIASQVRRVPLSGPATASTI